MIGPNLGLMCKEYNCSKITDEGCGAYYPEGVVFRCSRGYCPVLDDGPNRFTPKKQVTKKRLGQQKQRRK